MTLNGAAPAGEQLGRKFEAAWQVFSTTCAEFLAQEASYQAWFAHYVISQFGIDRVAREAIVHIRHMPEGPWRNLLGVSEARLDIVVSRAPGVRAVHYANQHYKAADGTGLSALSDLAVISELKVSFTQAGGLGHSEVVQDAAKLAFLLQEHRRANPEAPQPLAYLCVLDNHPRQKYRFDTLRERMVALEIPDTVRLLHATADPRPALDDAGEPT
ncbi:hypothetical protein [Prauserella muralis]|uniref:Uncharacterized protein n=1 Tax=Prauserella muralis TaxID=588067 RepID=A0A2V4AIB7_9PSEU|nr:hypothetical protein [Prauserella muralis]PXY19619.1 hypothetical protein BAY60_33445 [Prauserella muralis]TWE29628.1 hypothetical protein FHX69_2315 [Prauserella muralis]